MAIWSARGYDFREGQCAPFELCAFHAAWRSGARDAPHGVSFGPHGSLTGRWVFRHTFLHSQDPKMG